MYYCVELDDIEESSFLNQIRSGDLVGILEKMWSPSVNESKHWLNIRRKEQTEFETKSVWYNSIHGSLWVDVSRSHDQRFHHVAFSRMRYAIS
jgi:uncharacterized protein (DUF2235 family)